MSFIKLNAMMYGTVDVQLHALLTYMKASDQLQVTDTLCQIEKSFHGTGGQVKPKAGLDAVYRVNILPQLVPKRDSCHSTHSLVTVLIKLYQPLSLSVTFPNCYLHLQYVLTKYKGKRTPISPSHMSQTYHLGLKFHYLVQILNFNSVYKKNKNSFSKFKHEFSGKMAHQ